MKRESCSVSLCDPMDCRLSGSSVHGILQARIWEWVVIPFSRASSQPRDQTQVSHIAGGFFLPAELPKNWWEFYKTLACSQMIFSTTTCPHPSPRKQQFSFLCPIVVSYLILAEKGDKVHLNEGLRLKFSVFGLLGLLAVIVNLRWSRKVLLGLKHRPRSGIAS